MVSVASEVKDVGGIGSFDSFVYYADSGNTFAVESYNNGTFSSPRPFDIGNGMRVT
jgi:hypothetical protein